MSNDGKVSKSRWLCTGKASQVLGVSANTHRGWAKKGLLTYHLTPGRQRRFNVDNIYSADLPANHQGNFNHKTTQTTLAGNQNGQTCKGAAPAQRMYCKRHKQTSSTGRLATNERRGAIYCRVSSGKQKDDLQRQIEHMQQAYPGYAIFKDVTSGLN